MDTYHQESVLKRKRQKSVQKKKLKKKAKQNELSKEGTETKVEPDLYRLDEIDDKFEELFKDVGLVKKDYSIYKSRANGNCGSNCTALNCHQDESLGPYVRKNVNEYLVDFFPFFEDYYTYPLNIRVGSGTEPFQDKAEFSKFLKK